MGPPLAGREHLAPAPRLDVRGSGALRAGGQATTRIPRSGLRPSGRQNGFGEASSGSASASQPATSIDDRGRVARRRRCRRRSLRSPRGLTFARRRRPPSPSASGVTNPLPSSGMGNQAIELPAVAEVDRAAWTVPARTRPASCRPRRRAGTWTASPPPRLPAGRRGTSRRHGARRARRTRRARRPPAGRRLRGPPAGPAPRSTTGPGPGAVSAARSSAAGLTMKVPMAPVPARGRRTTSHALPSSKTARSSSTEVGGGECQAYVASRFIGPPP